MSRRLDPKSLAELSKLTRVREMAALDQASRAARRVAAVDAEIEALQSRSIEAETLFEAAIAEKWQMWRRQELVRLNQRKAKLIVEHRRAMADYGRVSAEHAVLGKLRKRAETEAVKGAGREGPYIS